MRKKESNGGDDSDKQFLFAYYRPQTKFAKVMILHVSVILSTGGVPGQVQPPPGRYSLEGTPPPGRYSLEGTTPGQVHPLRQVPPWQVHPTLGRYTPRQVHPRQVHPPGQIHTPQPQCMLGYGQQAGGMHPTGMHSWVQFNFTLNEPSINVSTQQLVDLVVILKRNLCWPSIS